MSCVFKDLFTFCSFYFVCCLVLFTFRCHIFLYLSVRVSYNIQDLKYLSFRPFFAFQTANTLPILKCVLCHFVNICTGASCSFLVPFYPPITTFDLIFAFRYDSEKLVVLFFRLDGSFLTI